MGVLNRLHKALSQATLTTGRALGSRHIPTCFNGALIKLPPDLWTSLYSRYEAYNAAILRNNLKRGDFFMDIGAHHGLWSLFAAKLVGRSGIVVACEPSPAFSQLKRASLPYPQIQPLRLGLGARETEATFYAQGDATSGSFVSEVTQINRSFAPDVAIEPGRVSVKPVDVVVEQYDRKPDFIKIDVEGFELEVLKGSVKTLAEKQLQGLLIEIHPPQLTLSGGSETELFAFLAANGFISEVIDRNPNSLYTIVALRS
jgi:FkbM family methyltransferase